MTDAHRVSRAWGGFLAGFDWTWFATLSYRNFSSRENARRQYRDFLKQLQDCAASPIGWFVIEERGGLGRFHAHALIANVSNLNSREWEAAWYKKAGSA